MQKGDKEKVSKHMEYMHTHTLEKMREQRRRRPIYMDLETFQTFQAFRFDLWVGIVKTKRKSMGYISVFHFVRALTLHTRVCFSIGVYYKIEQGKQKPSLEQFMAINLVIFGTMFPPEKDMKNLVAKEWWEIENLQSDPESELIVPKAWAYENYMYSRDYEEESAYEVAVIDRETPKLYSKEPAEGQSTEPFLKMEGE